MKTFLLDLRFLRTGGVAKGGRTALNGTPDRTREGVGVEVRSTPHPRYLSPPKQIKQDGLEGLEGFTTLHDTGRANPF